MHVLSSLWKHWHIWQSPAALNVNLFTSMLSDTQLPNSSQLLKGKQRQDLFAGNKHCCLDNSSQVINIYLPSAEDFPLASPSYSSSCTPPACDSFIYPINLAGKSNASFGNSSILLYVKCIFVIKLFWSNITKQNKQYINNKKLCLTVSEAGRFKIKEAVYLVSGTSWLPGSHREPSHGVFIQQKARKFFWASFYKAITNPIHEGSALTTYPMTIRHQDLT